MEMLSEIYTGALGGFGSALGGAIFTGMVSLILRVYRAFFAKDDTPDGWHDNSAIFSPG
jgi:hypothetical protein